jgi:teichuronic acid biosynthesis glycosyltransferase TuaG
VEHRVLLRNDGAPQVSVIVPVFNAEAYVIETLASIQAQTFMDFDVHVIDDCSTDNSGDLIKAFCSLDQRFVYHRCDKNHGGPAGPRNVGIANSTGAFVAFCDSDDLWVPHKLEIQLDVITRPDVAIVCAAIRDFTDSKSIRMFPRPSLPVEVREISHAKLLLKNWIAMSSVMVKRSAFAAIGQFNTAKSHIAVEDFDMWLRMTSARQRIVRIAIPLVHYRKLPTSISASKSMMIRKALNVIGEDYARRGQGVNFRIIRPFHWLLYVGTSGWMRAIRREL